MGTVPIKVLHYFFIIFFYSYYCLGLAESWLGLVVRRSARPASNHLPFSVKTKVIYGHLPRDFALHGDQ